MCAPATTCSNQTKDGTETDVDCGGAACPKCADGKVCTDDADCTSALCMGGTCKAAPGCNDTIKNGAETDVDCGGGACPKCDDGKACGANADCTSGICTNGMCTPTPTCTDTIQNGGETDVDCGGPGCPKCPNGKACLGNGDCSSAVCTGNVCTAPASCMDSTKNGAETDVDCGGNVCPGCAAGKTCAANTDCGSGKCTAGKCVDVLLISQIQTRGSAGGNDEFVEIYNPGSAPVVFDSTWTLHARSADGVCATNLEGQRFAGNGKTIPPHGHILFTSTASPQPYDGAVTGDGTYNSGIRDASSVVLKHNGTVVDAVCFYYDTATQSALTGCLNPYTCEGTPVMTPHDNTGGSNGDVSLERKPGGSGGNAQDTGDSAADFTVNTTATPRNLASPATP
jgi:hypothetical protein